MLTRLCLPGSCAGQCDQLPPGEGKVLPVGSGSEELMTNSPGFLLPSSHQWGGHAFRVLQHMMGKPPSALGHDDLESSYEDSSFGESVAPRSPSRGLGAI